MGGGGPIDTRMNGKSQEWRSAAHELLVALAKDNKYIVSDMVILFLESAGYGLTDYSPLGGVFKRAAAAGIIKKIDQPKKTKQSLWSSMVFNPSVPLVPIEKNIISQPIYLEGFGIIDGKYAVTEMKHGKLLLERTA